MISAVTQQSLKRRQSRQALLASCGIALAASLIAQPTGVFAQAAAPLPPSGAFQGTFTAPQVLTVGGSVNINRGATADIITIGSNGATSVNAIINWTPTDITGSGPINFLPFGSVATFQNSGVVSDYTVLNRIIPADGNRGIRFDGTVRSRINDAPGGNVWFYSPGGIIAGARSVFDVGGLVLTANNIDITGGLFGNPGTDNTIRFRGTSNSLSQVEIEKDAVIRANNYVALVAPRVVQGGSVTVDGSVGYIAADQVDVRINNGLFDIEFLEGTAARSSPIEHSGTTTGPAETGYGDNHRIYLAAYPKNDAITVLVGGTLGYERATEASVSNGAIVLSAGSSVSDLGLGGGGLAQTATATNIIIGQNISGDVSFASSVTATATNEIIVAPQSGTTISVDGSLTLNAGHRVEIGADAGETIIVSGTLNASNISTAPDSEVYLFANRAAGATAPQGLITVGGNLLLQSSRGAHEARVRTIIDGGRITVGGITTLNASDFAFSNGVNGIGGSAIIDLRSAGSVFAGQDVSLFANASSRQMLDDYDVVIGGGSSGGSARIIVTNGMFSARDVVLQTNSANDSGNSGIGGKSLFQSSGGTTTLGNLSILANAAVGGEGFGGRPAGVIGDLQGGMSSLVVTGGAVTITNDLQVIADSNALFRRASSGNIVGGEVEVSAAAGSSLSVMGTATISAASRGSGVDAQGAIDIARGGQIDLIANGGTISVGTLDLDASATGSSALTRGGDAQGGDINIRATAGGVFAVNRTTMAVSSAQGGRGLTGGNATAGGITLLASGGTIDFASTTTLTAIGTGGSALESQFSPQGNGIQSGSGTGGKINITSGVLNGAGTQFDFTKLVVDASGRSAGLADIGSLVSGASGGAGTGGEITLVVNSGSFSGDELSFTSSGTGGNGAEETNSASAGAGGLGLGGRITGTFSGGSGTIGRIGFLGTGTGGRAGRGASDTGYGSINAAGNGGAGTGGTLNLMLGSSAISIGAIELSAGGTGSLGGGSSSRVGGIGGAGTAGSARFLFVQDPTIPNITINTDSSGGEGGIGVTGGAGGNAINTTIAALDVTAGALTATTVSVSANATGGKGGQGTSGTGGVGGNASAGTARVSSSGATANLIAPNLTVTANAIGGSGGNGARGGAASGGSVSINGTGGALSSARLIASATGTGGVGGLTTSGRGGAGGTGTGGSAAVSNIEISGSDTSLSVNTTGFGGAGGNGQSGGAGGNGFGGLGVNGGASLTLAGGSIALDSGLSLLSDGRGGRGGNGEFFSSFGQPGGNGTAGEVAVTLSGGVTSVSTSTLTLSASGFGGAAGFNSSSPGLAMAPNGSSAQGGSVRLSPSGGAELTASGVVSISANATATAGQPGVANANSNGGNGGSATAGTVTITGSNGGFVASGPTTTISANATAGNGGNGGLINFNGMPFIPGTGGNGGNATAGRVDATLQTNNANGTLVISAFSGGGIGGLSDVMQGNGGNALAAMNGGAFLTFDSGTNVASAVDVFTTGAGGTGRNGGNAVAGTSSISISGANTSLTASSVSQLARGIGGLGRNSTSVGAGGSALGGDTSLSLSGATAALTTNDIFIFNDASAGQGGSVTSSGNGPAIGAGGNGGTAIAGSANLTVTDSNASIGRLLFVASAVAGNAGQGVTGFNTSGASGAARGGNFALTQNGGTIAALGTNSVSLTLEASARGGSGGAGGGSFSGTSGGNATGGNLSIAINNGSTATPTTFLSSFNLVSSVLGGDGGNALFGATANGGSGGNAFGGSNSFSVSGALTDIQLTGLSLITTAVGGNGGVGASGGNGGDATQGRNAISVTDQASLRLQQTQSFITATTGGAGGNATSLGGGGGRGGNAFAGNAEQGISILVSQATLISDTLTLSANGDGGRGGNGGAGRDGALFPQVGGNGGNGDGGVGAGANGEDGLAGMAGGVGGAGGNGGNGGVGGIGEGGAIRIEVNDGGSGFGDATFTTGNLAAIAQGFGGAGGNGAAGGNGEAGSAGGKGGNGGDGNIGSPGQDLGYGSFTPGGRGGNGGNGADGGIGGNGGNGGDGGSSGFGGEARGGTFSLIVDSGTASTGEIDVNVDGRGGRGGLGGTAGLGRLGGIGGRGGSGGLGAPGGFGNPNGPRGRDGIPGAPGDGGISGANGIGGFDSSGFASIGYGGAISIRTGDGAGNNGALSATDVSLTASGQGNAFNGFPTNGTVAILNQNDGASPFAITFNSLSARANSNSTGFNVAGITIDTGAGGIEIADSVSLNTTANVSITATDLGRLSVVNSIDVNTSGGKIDITHFGTTGVAITSGRGTYTAWGNINVGLGRASGAETIVRASDRLSLLSFNGSINADILQGVTEVSIFANRDALIGSVTASSPPSPSGSLTSGLIDLRAGYDLFSASYNPSSAFVYGNLTATGSIQIRSGGDILIGESAALRSDNFIRLESGGDIIAASGASIRSALNVAPDMGYGTLGDITASAGAIIATSSFADDISSIVAGNVAFSAAGHSIILNGDAIATFDATFTSRDFLATINDAPIVGAPRRDDRGLLTAPCLEGNICVGTITATRNVNLGAATGLIGLPNQIFTSGAIAGDVIIIRANDTIDFGASARVASLSNLFVASLGGDVNITPTTVLDSGTSSLRLFAGGRINGAGVSLVTGNNIGLGAIGGVTLENLDVGNTLFTIDSDGATTNANAFITPGDVFIGSTLTGRTSNISISADAGISVGTARIMSGANLNLTATNGNLFLGTAEATAGLSGPSNISLQGLNILSNDLTAAGLIQLVATNSIRATNSVNAGGALTLNTELGAIVGATLIGNSVSLNSATSVTTGNVSATDGNITIVAATAINTNNLTASNGSVSLANQMGLITAGLITARNDFTLTTGSDLNFGGVSVGDDIRITTTGLATLGRLTTTGLGTDNDEDRSNIVLSAGGALSVSHANSANDFTATAARFETGLNTIITAGDIHITTTGDALLGNSQAGGFITVNSGGLIDFNTITSGADTSLIASTSVTGASSTAGGDIIISNGAAVTLGSATANGTFMRDGRQSAGNIFIQTQGNVRLNAASARTSIGIQAGGISGSGMWSAGEDITLRPLGAVMLNSLAAGDDIDIFGGTTISLTSGTTRGDGGDNRNVSFSENGLALNFSEVGNGSDITFDASGAILVTNLIAGDDISLDGQSITATGQLRTLGISPPSDASDVGLFASGAVNVNAIDAFANVNVVGGSFTSSGVAMAGETIAIFASGAVNAAMLSAGNDVMVTGGSAMLSDVTAGRALSVTSTLGGLSSGNLRSRTTTSLTSAGTLNTGNVTSAAGDISITSAAGVTTRDLTASMGSAFITNMSGAINTGLITVANDFGLTNTANIVLGGVMAGDDVTITGSALINVGTVTTTGLGTDDEGNGSNIIVSGPTVAFSAVNANGRASLSGGTITGTSVRSGRATNVNGTGLVDIGSALAGSSLMVAGATGVMLGNVSGATGNVTLTSSGGNVSYGGATVGQNLIVTALGDIAQTGIATVARDARFTGGNIRIASITVGDDLDITSRGLVDLASALTLRTPIDTGYGSMSDDSNISVTAAGAITMGSVHAVDNLTITGTLPGANSLTATSLTAGQSLLATVNGSSNIGSASGGSLVQVTTFGGNRVGTATSARGDVILGGTPSIIALGDATAGRDIILNGLGGGVTHTGTANAARSVFVNGGSATLGTVIAGDDINISSSNPLTAASLTTTGTAPMLGAGSDITINITLGTSPTTITNANAFSALRVTTTGTAALGTARAGTDLSVTARSINAGNSNAGAALSLTSTIGDIVAANLTGGSVTANSAGSSNIGSASGSSLVQVTTRGLNRIGTATSANGDVVLTATTGNVDLGAATAGRDINVSALAGNITQTGIASATRHILIGASGAVSTQTLRATNDIVIDGNTLAATNLTAGGVVFVDIDDSSTIGTASGGTLVQVQTGGDSNIGSATSATGNVIVTTPSGNITLGALNAGRNLSIFSETSNVTQTGNAIAALTAFIDGDSVSVGTVSAGNDIVIGATGSLTAASLTTTGTAPNLGSGSNIIVDAASANITNANAFDALTINTTGYAALGTSRAGTSLTVTGGSINAGVSSAGTGLTLTSTSGDIVAANLTGGRVALNSAGLLTAGDIIATSANVNLTAISGIDTGDITASLGSVSLTNGSGMIATGLITARNDFTLTTGSDLTFGGVSVGDDIRITTTGSATLGRLTTTGAGTDNEGDGSNIVLSASNSLSVDHANSANDFTSNSGRFETGLNTIITAGDIDITTRGDALLGNSQAGGFINVNAGGVIDFTSISSGGFTSLFSNQDVTGGSTTSGATTSVFARDISIDSVIAGDSIDYQSFAGGVIDVGTSTSAGDILVNGEGAVILGTVAANGIGGPNSVSNGGNIFVVTLGDVAIGTATARAMIGISGNAVRGTGTWTAGEDIYVGAATNATLATLSAGDNLDIIAPGGISLTNGIARGDARDDRSLQLFDGSGSDAARDNKSSQFIGGSTGLQFQIIDTPSDGADIGLTSSNAVSATNLTAGDDINVTTTGAVTITGLASTNGVGVIGIASDIDINAGSATIAAATAFDDLRVITSGNSALGTSQAGGNIVTSSGGSTSFTSLTSGSSTQIGAIGAVTGGNVSAVGSIEIDAGGALTIGSATSTAAGIELFATNAVTATNLTAAQSVEIETDGSVNVTSINATLAPPTSSDLQGISIQARGNIVVGTATGANIGLGSLGSVRANTVTANNLVAVFAGTTVDVDTVNTNGLFYVANASVLQGIGGFENVTGAGSFSGLAQVPTGGAVTLGTANAGTIQIAGGSVAAGNVSGSSLLQVSGVNGVTLGNVASASGDVLLSSTGGSAAYGDATAGRNLTVNAQGDIRQTGTASVARDARFNGGSVRIAAITVGDDLDIMSAGLVDLVSALTLRTPIVTDGGLISDDSNILITAGGAVTTGTVRAVDNLTITGSSLGVTSLTAGQSLLATIAGASNIGTASGGSLVQVNAGSANRVGTAMSARGDVILTSSTGSIELGAANAGRDLSLTAMAGNITQAGTATAARDVSVSANTIALGTVSAGARLGANSAAGINYTSLTSGTSTNLQAGSTIIGGAISAGTANVQAAGTARITSLTSTGAASVTATNGIDIASTAIGAGLMLSATNGAVLVANDLRATGQVTATGRDITLRAIGALDVGQANATNGSIRLTSNGDVSGSNLTAAAGDISLSGRNATLAGNSDASGAIIVTTPGLATLAGRALAATIDVRSSNIAVGATAQIGAQARTATATFTNTGNSVTTIGGAGVQSGYSLSNAEIGRVFAGDITINAPRIGQDSASTGQVSTTLSSRAPDVILDTLTLSGANNVAGATAGNIGTSGRLTINTTGKLRTVGAATLSNLTSANRFIINASEAIEVDTATGLINLRSASGGLGGTLVLNSSDVVVASASARSDVTNAADIGAINDRLARNDGETSDEGYLRADTINVSVGNNFFVQNSGANSANLRNFSNRRGLSVGAGGLNINLEGSISRIVINGRQVDSAGGFIQGVDFLREVKINGGTIALGTVARGLFDVGSTINGCAILNVASCQVNFDNGNIARDVIEEALLEEGKSKLPDALFEVKEAVEIDFQPLIDDPVTGAGNDDNWSIADKAECAPDDESCAEPK